MKNVAKFAYGLVAACVLAVGGLGLAQGEASGQGTVQIVSDMANSITMNETKAVITIKALDGRFEAEGEHRFDYTNYTTGPVEVTAALSDPLPTAITLFAATEAKAGTGVGQSIELSQSPQVIVADIPGLVIGGAAVTFEAMATAPFKEFVSTITYTISGL